MAFRELTMIDVKEVLRRWGRRGRATGRLRVRRASTARPPRGTRRWAASLFERGRELTEQEVHEVAQRVQARPILATSTEWGGNEVAQHRARIEAWLAGDAETRPLRLTKIPHAAGARSRSARELRHALALRARRARVAREAVDGVRVDDPPPRSGGADRLRQDGRDRRRGDGTSSRPSGRSSSRSCTAVTPVRVADVPPDDRDGLRRTRPRVDVLRRDHQDADPGQHEGDHPRSRRALADARSRVPRLRAGSRDLCRPRTRALARRTSLASKTKSPSFARAGGSTARSSPASRTRARAPLIGAATSPVRACMAPRGRSRAKCSNRSRR